MLFITLIMIGLIFGSAVSIKAADPIEGDETIHDISFFIEAGSEYVIYDEEFTYVEGTGVFGDVLVTGTAGVDFFLGNEETYNTWNSTGVAFGAFYSVPSVTDIDIEYKPPATGPAYIVFDNRDGVVGVEVDFRFYIDRTGPDVIETNIEEDIPYVGDVNFFISISDAHFVLGYTEISFDGKVYSSSEAYNPTHTHDLEWASANFDDGAHIWEVYMEDELGNNRTTSYRVFTDNHPDPITTGPNGINWFGVATLVGIFCIVGIPVGLVLRSLAQIMSPKVSK